MSGDRLTRDFFARNVAVVARDLLGREMVSQLDGPQVTVRLTEVEAYAGPLDPASHAFRRTARSEIMWGEAGHLYVYFVYGMHWCANIVTGPPGAASAMVLIAGAFGADARLVAFMTYTRVVCVAGVASVLAAVLTGHAGTGWFAVLVTPMPVAPVLATLGVAAAGLFAGKAVRLPAAPLLGPMLVGTALNLAGILHPVLPPWLRLPPPPPPLRRPRLPPPPPAGAPWPPPERRRWPPPPVDEPEPGVSLV